MRKKDIAEVKKKLLNRGENGSMLNSHWRLSNVAELCKEGRIESVNIAVAKNPADNLIPFSQDTAIEVLHVFMAYVPDRQTRVPQESSNVEGSIINLARLDAFVFKIVSCLGDSGRDTIGGHRQKSYYDTFADALPKATNQLIGIIRRYVEKWAHLISKYLSWAKMITAAPQLIQMQQLKFTFQPLDKNFWQ